MASSELKGTIYRIGSTENVTDSYRKRELVLQIDTDTQYPQLVLIEAGQDKCEDQNLNEARVGDEVTVSFNFRGRAWNDPKKGKEVIFNTLQYWKMAINKTTAAPKQQAQSGSWTPPTKADGSDDDESLPF